MVAEEETIRQFNKLIENFKSFRDFNGISINGIEDIKKLPFTTREGLDSWSIEKAPEKPYRVHVTSGSSGMNVPIFYSKEAWEKMIARGEFIFGFMNLSEKDIILNLFEYGLSCEGILGDDVVKRMNATIFSCGNLDKEKISIVPDLIEKVKPTGLFSFPSFIYDLTRSKADLSSIKKVVYSGTFVSKEFFDLLNSKLNADFYNLYGCNEVGAISIGMPFRQEYMEVIDNGLYLEVLQDNNEISEFGEGKIIITDLYNYSTPMIRYFLGDRVRITEENGKKLIKLLGRQDNYVKISGAVHPVMMLVASCMKILSHDHFSITVNLTQDKSKDELLIYLLKEDSGKAAVLKQAFNEKLNLFPEIKFLNRMPMSFSGKIKNFVDLRKY